MEAGGAGSNGSYCYYSLLCLNKNASPSEIRAAYRKLALKWHPDRWAKDPNGAAEAKKRFQLIQEAYSVLSDKGKRALYDAGLFDPLEDDDQDFTDFMQEMLVMMDNVKNEKPDTLEDLQKMLEEIVASCGADVASCGADVASRGPSDGAKRKRVAP